MGTFAAMLVRPSQFCFSPSELQHAALSPCKCLHVTGGSALASDTIHRELQQLRAAGKPVIASMGDVAASGGYYIATAADAIVAQPGTITGSIGVIFGKFVVDKVRRLACWFMTENGGQNESKMSRK